MLPRCSLPGREPLTYRELVVQIERVGAMLADAGIGRRDRVALVLPNGPEMATAFLGVVSTAICAPLNPDYRHAEFDFSLGDLAAKALVVASESDSPAREIAKRRQLPVLELVMRPERRRARSTTGPWGVVPSTPSRMTWHSCCTRQVRRRGRSRCP